MEEEKEKSTTEEAVAEGSVNDGADENVKETESSSEEKELENTEESSKEEAKEEGEDTPPEEESEKEDKEEEEKPEEKDLKDVDAKNVNKEEASDVLKDKGFDYTALQKEFNEKGEISKETRESLAEVGITDEIIDNYIEGQKARVEKELDDISEVIGGREQLNEVIKWASKNLTDEEKASINGITDANVMKVYLKDLKNRMEEKEGKMPENTLNGEGGKPSVEMFESQAQMFEAIRDPKYKTDEVYRAKVMKKIQASRDAGIDLGI